MTDALVAAGYHTVVQRRKGCDPLLRSKISTEGRSTIRCWDAAGELRELPSQWRHTRSLVKFRANHLWATGSGFGLVVSVVDLQVQSEAPDEDLERVRPQVCSPTFSIDVGIASFIVPALFQARTAEHVCL